MVDLNIIKSVDAELYAALKNEHKRQQDNIELIASENFVSEAVMAVAGTHLTNKYAEGYPDKRYYGGCEWVDVAESLAISRAKELFGAEHANVQPHSGSQANFAVYFTVLKPGDTYLGMNLNHGGHLTHGSPVNVSGQLYNVVPYGVDMKTHRIDYDELASLAKKHKPKLIVAGASAYSRAIDFKKFKQIADEVEAPLMVDMAHIAGLVAAGLHQSPVPYADFVTTTTHKTLRGPRGGMILCKQKYAKDIDKAIFPGSQGGPLMHVIAAKALALKEALSDDFKVYQKQIIANAKALADALLAEGLKLVSGGTDTHLMLISLLGTGLTGKQVEKMLDDVRITANKNTIPDDPESPFVTSGLRVGTPSVTTRGMKEDDMKVIASSIARIILQGEKAKAEVVKDVKMLCDKYPLYEGILN